MKNRNLYIITVLAALLIMYLASNSVHAQDDANVEETKETIEALGDEDLLDVEMPAEFEKDGVPPYNRSII
jgi:hypothetical protein